VEVVHATSLGDGALEESLEWTWYFISKKRCSNCDSKEQEKDLFKIEEFE
jgi:hypothetical protein